MSEKRIRKALRKLEEIDPNRFYEFMFRDGHQETHMIYTIRKERRNHPFTKDQYFIYYQNRPLTADDEFGSKLEIEDIFPSVECTQLGYVINRDRGEKISLMPFQD